LIDPSPVDPDSQATRRSVALQGFWRVAGAIGKLVLVILAIAIGMAQFGYDYLKSTNSPKPTTAVAADLSKMGPATVQEWQLANADHEIIATAVAACSKIFDLEAQPDFIRSQLRLDTLPDGRRNSYLDSDRQKSAKDLILSNFQRAAIYLSDSITRGRVEAATNANVNYSSMFWFQLAIVGIGAITTILISIKSIAPTGNSPTATSLSLWVGILAIIFSSVGTATSALNSFYGPRESYLKSERSLAALRQLHSEIAAKITSATDAEHPEKCPKLDPANKDDPYGKQVQDWTTKLGAIVNATDSGSSSSQSTSGSAGPPLPKGAAPAPSGG
jgi:hypothetical protein